jgi:hypothetical protein
MLWFEDIGMSKSGAGYDSFLHAKSPLDPPFNKRGVLCIFFKNDKIAKLDLIQRCNLTWVGDNKTAVRS